MRVLSADNKLPVVRKMTPGYTKFDLSHAHKLSGDMGYLIPICLLPCMPGDRVKIGAEAVLRFMPMVAPVLHEIWATIDYYYVPYRIVDDTFVDFITGGEDGLDTTSPPRWNPSTPGTTNTEGTLWDYLGFPTNVVPSLLPVDWPRRAYNKIWNWHYRNLNLQTEIPETNEDLKLRNWESDYFTAALPWQQRGIAPALPVTGTLSAEWAAALDHVWPAVSASNQQGLSANITTHAPYDNNTKLALEAVADHSIASLNANTIDASGLTTFDIADLREAIQIQRFLEINARSGARFNEFLRGQFDAAPIDKTLAQPEFIGRAKFPVMVDEVVQTSKTDSSGTETPQGTMAGKGLSVTSDFVGSIRIDEPGLIMGLLNVQPKPAYQQGIDRAWLIESKYEYPFPVFANLSEQQIKTGELYCDGTSDDAPWAYTGRFDEYRIMRYSVHGLLKKTTGGLAHWHMGRIFGSQPGNNETFIQADCSAIKARVMAIPSEPTFVANVGNRIEVVRPLTMFANPSIMERL